MEKTLYYCDNCLSQGQTLDYQLDSKNFITLRVEIWGSSSPNYNQRHTFKLCLNCAPDIVNNINNVINTLKLNVQQHTQQNM